jgi:heat shock protein HtpX
VVGLLFILLLPGLLLATGLARGYAWIAGRPGRKSARGFTRFNRIVLVATAGLLFVLTLSVRAFSRRREFAADDRAARVTGRPAALANALQKVERASEGPAGLLSQLYISGEDDTDEGLQRLLSTHPPMSERVARLERLAREQAAQRWTTIPIQ